ncbi:MAG: lipocalin-like domain-containing protein [Acidobacteriota bacterium]
MKEQFVGVWSLMSYEMRYDDGRVTYPYGPHPVGRLTYDKSGRMSAQLMNPQRPGTTYVADGGGIRDASEGDLRKVVSGFVAYCGTFDVDETKHQVIHHVKIAMHPAWAGGDQHRAYELDGNRLTLSVMLPGRHSKLVWEREPD